MGSFKKKRELSVEGNHVSISVCWKLIPPTPSYTQWPLDLERMLYVNEPRIFGKIVV
jgi:hypothetical protein